MLNSADSRRFSVTQALAPLTVATVLLLAPATAFGQSIIKQPGNHPDYSVEVEPHFVFQWSNRWGDDDGFGPGVRINIPFLDNGPISKINNNMAIGFGMDITFGDDDCRWGRRWRYWGPGYDCNVTEFWFPVVLQWNFFLTKVISVFGEPGFALAHRRWDWEYPCGDIICDDDDSDTEPEFVFWGGARFNFSDTIGATVRIGTPYISAGINFML